MTTQESSPAAVPAAVDSRLAAARELLRSRVRAALTDPSAAPGTAADGTAGAAGAAGSGSPAREPVASFAQERMWLADRMADGRSGYA
ncbi:hypothetical protein ACIQOD_31845, partial [Streptomyces sp. NPDC091259]